MATKDAGHWTADAASHARLIETYSAPVTRKPTTISNAGVADDSIISVSTIEHFSQAALDEFTREARRVLQRRGHLVLTVDLFPDVVPFISPRPTCTLRRRPHHGRPRRAPRSSRNRQGADQASLSANLLGYTHPPLAQCVVARKS